MFYSHSEKAWIARVSLGTVRGKPVRHKVRASSEAAARRELETLHRTYLSGNDPATGTLDAYLAEWLPAHSRSIRASTAASYETHVRLWIAPLLGGIPLAKLERRDVRRLVDHLERKGKSAGYIHLILRTLSVALQQAVDDRTLQHNAVRGVRLPKIEREPVQAMTDPNADAITDAVTGSWLENVVRVLFGSGLRRGEVLGLDQRDLMLDEGYVIVRKSKTRIKATPVTDDAVEALRDALRQAPRRGPDEPVFFGPRANRKGHRDRLRGDTLTHALPKLLEASGVDRLAPHGLRHGFATLMLLHGADLRYVQNQLDHSRISQTAQYAHVVPSAARSAIAGLDRRRAR